MRKLLLAFIVVYSFNVVAEEKRPEIKVQVNIDDLIKQECEYSENLNPEACVQAMTMCFDTTFYRRILIHDQTSSQKATKAFYDCSTIE